jgi:hypothetical protein
MDISVQKFQENSKKLNVNNDLCLKNVNNDCSIRLQNPAPEHLIFWIDFGGIKVCIVHYTLRFELKMF